MFKKLFGTFIMFILSLMLTTAVYAANLSVRIEVPKTPTNQNTFKINFVAMDISGETIEVKCFKSGDAVPFSTINLSAGGNTGNCEVTPSIIPTEGTYGFYVTAATGSETQTSPTVNVEYKTSAPGVPGNYNKEQLGCQYKITFKTADDGGRTSRVEVYRSDQISFTADSGTRVGTVWIGSNLEGSFIDTVPDCGKGYYYVIRAFDGAGNGSGLAGDSITKVTVVTTQASPSPAAPVQGAIPVASPAAVGVGEILGADEQVVATKEGEILGEGTPSALETPQPAPSGKFLSPRNLFWLGLVLLLAGGYYFYQRYRKSASD